MEFQSAYLHTLRDRNPKLFRELVRSGQIDQHLKDKTREAYQLLHELTDPLPKGVDGLPLDPQAQSLAEERVMSQMLSDVPLPEDRQAHAEPPDDLTQ